MLRAHESDAIPFTKSAQLEYSLLLERFGEFSLYLCRAKGVGKLADVLEVEPADLLRLPPRRGRRRAG